MGSASQMPKVIDNLHGLCKAIIEPCNVGVALSTDGRKLPP
jgi:hypothetical protein